MLERWARGLIKTPFSPERVDHGVEGMQVLALIQRVREAEAELLRLKRGLEGSYYEAWQRERDRVVQLERVQEAASTTVTLAEQNDYSADEAEEIRLWELRSALAAVEEK